MSELALTLFGPPRIKVDGRPVPLGRRKAVALLAGPGLAVDVVRFRSLVASVAGHSHPPVHRCADCLAALTEAAALCQDEFLAGFSLGDAPEFDLWRTLQAENLACELATVLERLAHVHAGLQRFELAIGYARRGLALDPLHEPAHRTLMQLHAWTGDAQLRLAAVRGMRPPAGG